ncbi:ATP-binding protein [Streptomyces sp. NPDC047014]|uniref:ATP-binding protein n=1 Tax=Streptomyces sp. NPDC047014 TaxID=3155736 RepID=UPI0034007965
MSEPRAALRGEEARDITRKTLAYLPQGVVDDALTIVSELVSNALRHAGGVTGFSIRLEADRVVIEVSDASRAHPHSPGSPAHVPGGFGWMLVNRLAGHTQIRTGPGGKTITAHLAL